MSNTGTDKQWVTNKTEIPSVRREHKRGVTNKLTGDTKQTQTKTRETNLRANKQSLTLAISVRAWN